MIGRLSQSLLPLRVSKKLAPVIMTGVGRAGAMGILQNIDARNLPSRSHTCMQA